MIQIFEDTLNMSIPRDAVRAINLSDNRQPDLYASSTIPFALALISVLLRFWCRWTNRAGLKLDDWLILTALVRSHFQSIFLNGSLLRLLTLALDLCCWALSYYVMV